MRTNPALRGNQKMRVTNIIASTCNRYRCRAMQVVVGRRASAYLLANVLRGRQEVCTCGVVHAFMTVKLRRVALWSRGPQARVVEWQFGCGHRVQGPLLLGLQALLSRRHFGTTGTRELRN